MQVTVAALYSDLILTIECNGEDKVSTLKEKVAAQTGVPTADQILLIHERPIDDEEVLKEIGISDGDLVMMQKKERLPTPEEEERRLGIPSANQLLNRILRNPPLLTQINAQNPVLAEALSKNDLRQADQILDQMREQEASKQREMQTLLQNPMDVEAQKKIEEMIRQKNVADNFAQALEHNPEVFGSVSMLYVNMEVNGHAVQAFIDSGAQMTIMTAQFAEKCGLLRLVDKRFEGLAIGVGESKIIGRVHQAPLKVSEQFVSSSVVIMEQKSGPQFIFGLDNLIRHQCCIDLKGMTLNFGSIKAKVPFLHEHEITHTDSRLPPNPGQSSSSPQSDVVSPEKLEKLMVLGFSREQCIEALTAAQGNEDAAAALLFDGLQTSF